MVTKAKDEAVNLSTKVEPKAEADMTTAEKKDAANPMVPAGPPGTMEDLPAGHTYVDRLKAQARSYGIVIPEGTTEEALLFLIKMKASAVVS